jgi:hypothetical protein
MIGKKAARLPASGFLLGVIFSPGCSQAPSFDIIGSFFPAWLVCLALATLFTAVVYWALLRARVPLALPVLTYPSLTVLITLALWLTFFR